MKYDVWGVTGQLFPGPCRAYDADGVLLSPLLSCDTETGEVVRYETNQRGGFVVGTDGGIVTIRERRPAPLRIVPVGDPVLAVG